MSTWKMVGIQLSSRSRPSRFEGVRAALGFIDEFFCLVPTFARSWLTWGSSTSVPSPHLLTAADVGHRPISRKLSESRIRSSLQAQLSATRLPAAHQFIYQRVGAVDLAQRFNNRPRVDLNRPAWRSSY